MKDWRLVKVAQMAGVKIDDARAALAELRAEAPEVGAWLELAGDAAVAQAIAHHCQHVGSS